MVGLTVVSYYMALKSPSGGLRDAFHKDRKGIASTNSTPSCCLKSIGFNKKFIGAFHGTRIVHLRPARTNRTRNRNPWVVFRGRSTTSRGARNAASPRWSCRRGRYSRRRVCEPGFADTVPHPRMERFPSTGRCRGAHTGGGGVAARKFLTRDRLQPSRELGRRLPPPGGGPLRRGVVIRFSPRE